MKKTDIEDGYILTDGDSEIDIESMIEERSPRFSHEGGPNKIFKEIKLYKDGIEYVGILKKFVLKETADGKTIISVVFNLNS